MSPIPEGIIADDVFTERRRESSAKEAAQDAKREQGTVIAREIERLLLPVIEKMGERLSEEVYPSGYKMVLSLAGFAYEKQEGEFIPCVFPLLGVTTVGREGFNDLYFAAGEGLLKPFASTISQSAVSVNWRGNLKPEETSYPTTSRNGVVRSLREGEETAAHLFASTPLVWKEEDQDERILRVIGILSFMDPKEELGFLEMTLVGLRKAGGFQVGNSTDHDVTES